MKRILLASAAIICAVALAQASVTPNSFVTPQTPNAGVATFIQGTDGAGVPKTIYTGQTNGSKCFALLENNDDQSATHVVTFHVIHSSVTATIATLLTTTSGGSGVYGTTVDAMSLTNWPGLPRDGSGNPYIFLSSGDTLKAQFATNLTSSAQINLLAFCSDF